MAIIINNVKYACGSCIRGHRVKKCNHNDRKLIQIVKRGRQVSQCNHCRDLRKTNRTHVKCTCAIARTPNPINGCLCEVIKSCSCVASHLQEVYEDDTRSPSESPALSTLQLSLIKVSHAIIVYWIRKKILSLLVFW
ncbi:copper fist DNA binding domain-containing protein [Cokeromyces recurvatus]|uniref:copper fist DNA binding domain-containing protein n=1 Tax=Cokeromyces recurvatus TaxID=90255 RepID=UPI00221F3468|nr:copper fist DNA binding domain-containing protein [Cokeromyces recurvatus]KAI7901311.1 copper fist DNA binding domain-containing protein [Cokeromyces recurvatus]